MKQLGIRAAVAAGIVLIAFVAVSTQQQAKDQEIDPALEEGLTRLEKEATEDSFASGGAERDELLVIRGGEPESPEVDLGGGANTFAFPTPTAAEAAVAVPPSAAPVGTGTLTTPPEFDPAMAAAVPASDFPPPEAGPSSTAMSPEFAPPAAGPEGATLQVPTPQLTAAPQPTAESAAPLNTLRGADYSAAPDTPAAYSAPATYAAAPSSDLPAEPSQAESNPAAAPTGLQDIPELSAGAAPEVEPQNYPQAPSQPTASALGSSPVGSGVAPEMQDAPLPAAPQYSMEPMPAATPSPEPTAAPSASSSIDSFAESTPGERHLEGGQAPSVFIQKQAPAEVKVGQPAEFTVTVENTGTVVAKGVVVHDRVPQGTKLEETVPAADRVGDLLLWDLGDLEPGNQRTLTMRLVPVEEGELGSVAQVSFNASASVRTISTRPALKVVQRGPEHVLVGQQVEIEIEVSNPGTGSATGVVLHEDVPQGLEHPKGRQLDNYLGDLAPGETRRLSLRMIAREPGVVKNVVSLESEENLQAQHSLDLNVTSPRLELALDGPSRRYLERRATYNVAIENVGTAMATNIDVVAHLDRGLSFVATESKGQYDPEQHAVFWSLAELPAGKGGVVALELLPVEAGEHAIRLEARGDLGMSAQTEKEVSVDTLAELTFSVADSADPIEVGSTTTYEVKVSNIGTREDTNIELRVALPSGMQFVQAEGQSSTDGSGGIIFPSLPRLAPGNDYVYRFEVAGQAEGPQKIEVSLKSDALQVPITKEEATLVYADQ